MSETQTGTGGEEQVWTRPRTSSFWTEWVWGFGRTPHHSPPLRPRPQTTETLGVRSGSAAHTCSGLFVGGRVKSQGTPTRPLCVRVWRAKKGWICIRGLRGFKVKFTGKPAGSRAYSMTWERLFSFGSRIGEQSYYFSNQKGDCKKKKLDFALWNGLTDHTTQPDRGTDHILPRLKYVKEKHFKHFKALNI